MWRGTTLLVALTLVSKVSARSYDVADYKEVSLQIENDDTPESEPYVATVSDEEYIRHVHAVLDAGRGRGRGGAGQVPAGARVDSRLRAWKRNADLINSLLALPKGMNEAGR